MHLGNSILCPYSAALVTLVSGGAVIYSIKKVKDDFRAQNIFKILSMTLFVFALQMIDFTIPMTHSSGHIIGGFLLAAILGAPIGFLAMCAILFAQALLLGDGSLGALPYNIFNMGFIGAFVAYPLIFKPLEKKKSLAVMLASFCAVISGALFVVFEMIFVNHNMQEIAQFAFYMLSIHFAIAIFEGVFGVLFLKLIEKIKNFYPAMLFPSAILLALISTKITSSYPDGFEWAVNKAFSAFDLTVNSPVLISNFAAFAVVALFGFMILKISKKGLKNSI